jgi:probable HAF family extracellular repeat protein
MERSIARLATCVAELLAFGLGLSGAARAAEADPHAHHQSGPREVRYAIDDLGFFQAREAEERPGLNSSSTVAAWRVLEQTRVVATILRADGPSELAHPFPRMNAYAFGINDRNQAVGQLESSADLRETRGFFYDGAQVRLLPGLGGPHSTGRAISRDATIVGNAQTRDLAVHAVEWTARKARDLGTLHGGDFSRAYSINASDDIVGESNQTANGKAQAVMWSHGRIRKLGMLPGGTQSVALSLNDRGDAVGYADDAGGNAKAVLFSGGRLETLGTLGDDPSLALDINEAGQIVGNSSIHMGLMKMRAFLWERGHMSELDDLVADSGWLLMGAFRINTRGEILAYGFFQGHTHLCLLRPLKQGGDIPQS